MAKYILEKIKIENALQDIITKTDGENTKVSYNGSEMSLTSALADILAKVNALPTDSDVSTAINTAIDGLINGAPDTYNTLKEIADHFKTHQDEYTALVQTVAGKLDKSVYDAFVATMGALAQRIRSLKLI